MSSSLRATGSTRRWRRIRLRVLERDGWRCGYCGSVASSVDHRVRREHGGNDDPAQLVACCRDCQYPSRRPQASPEPVVPVKGTRDRSGTLLVSGDYSRREAR